MTCTWTAGKDATAASQPLHPPGSLVETGREEAALQERVVVLVGPPASGKTTVRERMLTAQPGCVALGPDDERAALREQDVAAGRAPRELQDYSLSALRRCADAATALLGEGRGYIADATNLRRKERLAHVRAAHQAGLPVVGVLLPDLPLEVLMARNAARPALRRVPEDVLARHAHRRSLIDAGTLREEGFDEVVEVPVDVAPGGVTEPASTAASGRRADHPSLSREGRCGASPPSPGRPRPS